MARILMIDDSVQLLDLLTQFFELMNYDMRSARSGKLAYELLASGDFMPDVIVCDSRMPEMTGSELIAHVRAMPTLEHVFIILMSGDNKDDATARALGADAYLRKPFELGELDRLLRDHLDQGTRTS